MFTELFKKLLKVAWFLPGFLLWAAFPPMGEKTDVLFALAPLLWLSRQGDVRESVRRWLQSGLFFWVATLSWMPAIVKNGGPWPLVVLGWFGLAAYCTLFFVAFGWLSATYWRWVSNSNNQTVKQSSNFVLRLLGVLVVEPVLWCGLELIRSRLFGGFAWNHLGVVPANGGFGGPAALGGVYLLSAVVILINGTVAGIAERMVAAVRRRPVDRIRTFETLLAFALVWGIYRLPGLLKSVPEAEDFLKVALVQRNFPCVFKDGEENPYDTVGRLLENVSALKPDLVVFPESALCDIGPIGSVGARGFAQWVAKRTDGAATLAGGTRRDGARSYNSAALYGPDGWQAYDKVHLVPFGEFIPGDKLIPALQKLAPVGSCTPGEPRLLTLRLLTPDSGRQASGTNSIPLGVAICFEDTDSALMRRMAAMGARALVFITNDSWFSESDETVQHAWQAVARAVETGLPVVRVGNSGVSGTILPDGRPTWLVGEDGQLLLDRKGTMFDRIPVGPSVPTPYVCIGDGPLFVAFLLLIIGMILVKYRNNYEQRRKLSL